MKEETNILIAEDNKEHFQLIRKNLLRAGVCNEIHNFSDGRELLDFLSDMDKGTEGANSPGGYILLLKLDLPKVDGIKVLKKIKQNMQLKKIPVIILAAADDRDTIERCYDLGCSTYIVKPAERRDLEVTIQRLGCFLSIIETTLISEGL